MGTDIHISMEYQPKDALDGARWFCEVAELPSVRDYVMFGYLAGVRRAELPHIPPRGLPEVLSDEVSDLADWSASDMHHASWLTLDEFRQALRTYPCKLLTLIEAWLKCTPYPQGYNYRLVFWFDC